MPWVTLPSTRTVSQPISGRQLYASSRALSRRDILLIRSAVKSKTLLISFYEAPLVLERRAQGEGVAIASIPTSSP